MLSDWISWKMAVRVWDLIMNLSKFLKPKFVSPSLSRAQTTPQPHTFSLKFINFSHSSLVRAEKKSLPLQESSSLSLFNVSTSWAPALACATSTAFVWHLKKGLEVELKEKKPEILFLDSFFSFFLMRPKNFRFVLFEFWQFWHMLFFGSVAQLSEWSL